MELHELRPRQVWNGIITALWLYEGIQVDIGAQWDGCAISRSLRLSIALSMPAFKGAEPRSAFCVPAVSCKSAFPAWVSRPEQRSNRQHVCHSAMSANRMYLDCSESAFMVQIQPRQGSCELGNIMA